jgi:hypothetical protein
MREVEPTIEEVRGGEEGPYAWERRIAIIPVSAELAPQSGPVPVLYSVAVSVRWGQSRSVELTSLRTALPPDAVR